MLEREIEEILEALWTDAGIEEEKERLSLTPPHQEESLFQQPGMEEALKVAEERGLVTIRGGMLSLTEAGKAQARDIVRRHRLAERLFYDVFDVGSEEAESSACKFEHLLTAEATDSICILLGHPSTCPHGNPIPKGDCCLSELEEILPVVIPASQLRIGEEAAVAYLGSRVKDRLDRIASLGIFPGTRLTLLQRHPACIIRCGETELALDETILRDIRVRRSTPELFPQKTRHRHRRRRRW